MSKSKFLDRITLDEVYTSSKIGEPISLVNKTEKFEINKYFHEKAHTIVGYTKNSLSSVLVNPKFFKFNEQTNTETIIIALRPHWITNLNWIITTILMLFFPIVSSSLGFLDYIPAKYAPIITFLWYSITFIFTLEKFTAWYFDVYLITDERVVDIDYNNLLNKHFAQTDLRMIQDVSSSVKGIFGTYFNFGDILIQTASETNQIKFNKVSNPEKIIKILKEIIDIKGGKNDDRRFGWRN